MTSAVIDPTSDGDATLRMLAPSDLPSTLAWRNDPESRHWFHSSDPISSEQHHEWFARYLARENDYMFVLEFAGARVAQAGLSDVADGGAEFGRLLVDPAQRGKGHSRRAITLVLRVADDVLGLEHLILEVRRDNVRAIRGYEAAGFVPSETRMGTGDYFVMERDRS